MPGACVEVQRTEAREICGLPFRTRGKRVAVLAQRPLEARIIDYASRRHRVTRYRSQASDLRGSREALIGCTTMTARA